MRKKTILSILLLTIFTTTIFGAFAPVRADTLEVGSGKTYATIQDAINAASADDIIMVFDGTYYENLVIGKSLLFTSYAGASSTIIDAGGGLVAVSVDTVAIFAFEGFTVTNFGKAGVVAKNTGTVHIDNNIVTATTHDATARNGIQVGYVMDPTSTTGTIAGNWVSGCTGTYFNPVDDDYESAWTASGILVIAPNSVIAISDNYVYDCDVGMDIEAGSGTTIENNFIYDNSYDIVSWNANPIVTYNDILSSAICGVYRAHDGELDDSLDATLNWWGRPDIVGIITETDGNIDADPWLDASWEAGVPRTSVGETGDTGPEGDRGSRGLTGSQGPIGPQGEAGEVGIAGEDGSDGLQGPKGDAGLSGSQGIAGETGSPGAKGDAGTQGVAGEAGPQGSKGEQGDTGAVGPKGTKGEPAPASVAYGGAALGTASLLGLLYMFFRAKP